MGRAEATGLPDAAFDWITAAQCWHWFDPDPARAEIRRLLKPGGRLLVAYMDWLHEPGNPVDAMAELRQKHNPGWGRQEWPQGFYPQHPGELAFPGFTPVGSFEYVEDVPYTHVAWRGRIRAYAGIGGSLPPEAVARFDEEFAEVLARRFPVEPMLIPHKLWAECWVCSS